MHTGARPFECPICLRRFTQAVDLKRHMLRHSGQKPHVCHYCGKQYTRGDRLKVCYSKDRAFYRRACLAILIRINRTKDIVFMLVDAAKKKKDSNSSVKSPNMAA